MKFRTVACVVAAAVALGMACLGIAAGGRTPAERRAAAHKAFDSGNFNDAYKTFAALATDGDDDPAAVPEDLNYALQSLERLGRVDEIDAVREKTVAAHPKNWRLLAQAAQSLQHGEPYGFVVAGQFYRGGRRGNDGRQVNAMARDRVRALQLLRDAVKLTDNESDRFAVANLYFEFAQALLDTRYGQGAWMLQSLSDLSKLPDYEEGYPDGYQTRGAPVDAEGNPVYHALPKSWDDAKSDGERWRWCLAQAAEASPDAVTRARFTFASFLRQQFDVQTMAQPGYGRGGYPGFGYVEDDGPGAGPADDAAAKGEAAPKAGPYSVSTLAEDETIARLATGIKRFKLPDEFNFIKIYQDLARGNDGYAEQALNSLAGVFTDRQQYPKAADYWRQSIKRFGNGQWKTQQLHQIVGNWGKFDPSATAPAGDEPTLGFLFRNGSKVTFTAHQIKIGALLADVKAYLKSAPREVNWEQLDVQNVGYRLVEKNQVKYLGDEAARWDLALSPRDKHFDKRITVRTPLKKAGAYLVTAKMEDGNESRVVLWVADTVLVKKPLDGGTYYFVADAKTGRPVAKANLEFFGYRQQHVRDNVWRVDTHQFAEFTDASGQLKVNNVDERNNFAYLITATTPDGRLAYHGFTHVWAGRYYDSEYDTTKAFGITDRPVYRPGQKVQFKFWVAQAKYDQPVNAKANSPFAGNRFTVEIHNPKGEKVSEQQFTADEFGGVAGEFAVGSDATLGVYGLQLNGYGNASFRVEEYKKPEFEVKVDAPAEAATLGEKITATINARYYFGAPVAEAKVKYKVIRTQADASWYPTGKWDWFYGPGYGWFGCDYPWYPGFREWGCFRPAPWWYPNWSRQQPEVVMENEVSVGADGTVKVEIDTAPAKALHGDHDHQYTITAEVTDASRRTIVGTGSVSVAQKPFRVYAWVDRGYYLAGDNVRAEFSAQTLDHKPVAGKGVLKLVKVEYDAKLQPTEQVMKSWEIGTNEEGRASQAIQATLPGQYRLSYAVTDAKGRSIEGGYVFVVRGKGFKTDNLRFNDVELVAEKAEYQPGEKVRLMVNANRAGAAVVLFVRPTNGVYLPPKVIQLPEGVKSTVEEIDVVKKDMPNFFVEAFTVGDGAVFAETREIVVPPDNRVVNVEVLPSKQTYKPGEKATVRIKLTDANGEPVVGSAVVSVYDKSVEYIAGGSNVPEIKAFFWKWRRHHSPQSETSLKYGPPVARSGETQMGYLGQFGAMVADLALGDRDALASSRDDRFARNEMRGRGFGGGMPGAAMKSMAAAPAAAEMDGFAQDKEYKKDGSGADAGPGVPLVEPTVRKNFADTALWVATLTTDRTGVVTVELPMPENLTTWKTKVWSIASGTRVGQGEAEVVTTKDLLVRLQAPRFFVQKDEVVLSSNVHNYLDTAKRVKVTLEIDEIAGAVITSLDAKIERVAGRYGWELSRYVDVAAKGEARVDWRVRVDQPGSVVVRMKAQSDVESDAMQLSFPVNIHGMLKTDSYAGALRPGESSASIHIRVPNERLIEQSRLEIRYSPSVAAAMVDALPYLVEYPYGCTEQTLNRFIPTVITQRTLLAMGLDLKAIRDKRTNLNAQEIGDDRNRAQDWKRRNLAPWQAPRNPVFDEAEVAAMVKEGVTRLTNMQLSDGGWGWFSGSGEYASPHTTAVVVHGLLIARDNDVALVPGVLDRGIDWLKRHQDRQVELLKNAPTKKDPYKTHADNLDALVFMVLTDAGQTNNAMCDFLFRDRNELAVYSKAACGLAFHKLGERNKLEMTLQNLSQYVVEDNENQTAYLRLPENNYWWYWYGTDTEANGFYLKLQAKTDPKGTVAPKLAKYLINNRKNATYWNSTRDTAVCIEALAEYVKASGEDKPDMTVAVLLDGRKLKEVKINRENLFTFDNAFVLSGADVPAGEHRIEFARTGTGPLYFNAYVTNFTLEDSIKKAGLEVKVQRKFYRLVEVKDATAKVAGGRGQVVDQRVEKYRREPLNDGDTLVSGALVEVELEIDSKNDYEYLMFEDMKAAGFEPVEVRSGYNGNDLHAYMELRDERVCFFVQNLARGKHSVAYRLRAEIPGKFSALPAKASAMYAPELKANSDENKLNIRDAEPAKQPAPSELPAASGR